MSPLTVRREPLRVAVLSSASGGGAGIAARRVADALELSADISVDFIDMVALGGRMPDDAAPPGNMSNRRMTDTHFTVEFPGYVRGWVIDLLRKYDVLNIHWASFLLGLSEIDELSRLGTPILFTCHDYYYFTGGCHYPATCQNLSKGCKACPQVDQKYCSTTVIAQNLEIKKRILARPNVHLAAPSSFLVNEAVSAGLIRVDRTHVLRNPYVPVGGRDVPDSSSPTRIVLIADSMSETRKAMPLAIDSLGLAFRELNRIEGMATSFVVDIIGKTSEDIKEAVEQAGFSHCFHGKIIEHATIAKIFARSDFLLTCSYEDNWPNILVEAGCYGVVPVVGPGHGCEEFVETFGVGYIAKDYTEVSFASSIIDAIHFFEHKRRTSFIRSVVSAHSPELVQKAYFNAIKGVTSSASEVLEA